MPKLTLDQSKKMLLLSADTDLDLFSPIDQYLAAFGFVQRLELAGHQVNFSYQARFCAHADVRLHAKVPLVALLDLVHFRVALVFVILGGIGRSIKMSSTTLSSIAGSECTKNCCSKRMRTITSVEKAVASS